MDWGKKVVLITGGTGSLGYALTRRLLKTDVASIRIFSRGEHRQEQMARDFPEESKERGRLRFFIGDVRDKERLGTAMKLADYVIHAAALKIVPTCAYNPFEVLETNIIGSRNVIEAAFSNRVEKVIAVSTDKAVEPVTLYGASKAFMEQLFVCANNYHGEYFSTHFAIVRYGNVSCSKGSILPLVLAQKDQGFVTLTDHRCTRFWLKQSQAVELITKALENTRGGDIWIPKVPSMRVTDLVSAIAPKAEIKMIGLRAQEKLHEVLVTYEEARRTRDAGDCFVIEPEGVHWAREEFADWPKVDRGFRYSSGSGSEWVKTEQFAEEARAFMEGIPA